MCLSVTPKIAMGGVPLLGDAIVDRAEPSVADVLRRLAAVAKVFRRSAASSIDA
jgi:hypothetical protein